MNRMKYNTQRFYGWFNRKQYMLNSTETYDEYGYPEKETMGFWKQNE